MANTFELGRHHWRPYNDFNTAQIRQKQELTPFQPIRSLDLGVNCQLLQNQKSAIFVSGALSWRVNDLRLRWGSRQRQVALMVSDNKLAHLLCWKKILIDQNDLALYLRPVLPSRPDGPLLGAPFCCFTFCYEHSICWGLFLIEFVSEMHSLAF